MSPMAWVQRENEMDKPHCERCGRSIEDYEDDPGYGLCTECYDDYMEEKEAEDE